MPDFVAPQLCTRVERPPNEPGWVHEIKFDGYRIQLRIEHGKVSLKTRNGLDWTTKFGAIAKAASDLPDGIIDGEIVALDANGTPDFAALQVALSEGAQRTRISETPFPTAAQSHKLPNPARFNRANTIALAW
jgi:bifunctional non-homologous end joining protein LigD